VEERNVPDKTVIREAMIECMDCGVRFPIKGRIALGQEIACPECGTWMEVVSLDPVQVDWIYDELEHDQEQENW
jgi:DNA-directed RNA polymerase subunit RPC12/RpoP